MTVLYNQFSITQVVPDLRTKSIIIMTNFKIDPSTVNLKTVALYDYSSGDRRTVNYNLHVDGKNIIILLEESPTCDSKLFLKVSDIYDALNRRLNYAYNNYVVVENDVITKIDIISPSHREFISNNVVTIKLKVTDALTEGRYVVQIGADNAFFKTVSTTICNIGDDAINEDSIEFSTTIDYNGQLFIRARAERNETEVGRWSELTSFSMQTMPMDSMDTTFLEESITTFDLFPDEIIGLGETNFNIEIQDKNLIADIKDGVLYIEFNKDLLLPEDYEVDKDGYVSLGIITGFRKELK